MRQRNLAPTLLYHKNVEKSIHGRRYHIKYQGSKSRIAKYIVPIIQQFIDENHITEYYEPFVGGANVIDKIKCENRYGSDINPYLIEMFKSLTEDKYCGLPEEITREEYGKVRDDYRKQGRYYADWYIETVGFLASYNGKFFGGYAGTVTTKIGTIRDYYDEAKRNLEQQLPNLRGIHWNCCSYEGVMSQKSLIYCDIPYKNTTDYGTNFDHDRFWKWATEMSENNIVIVSETQAPPEWKSIWSMEIGRTIDNASRSKSVEHLFMIDRQ